MKSIALFCGSSVGENPLYSDTARIFTNLLCEKNLKIITGGGHVGIMGVIADEAIMKKGHIIGVIPQFLVEKEVAHNGLNEVFVVDTMHERKKKIESISDAFVALPGGFGTLDEIFEMITWAQLSLHGKPCCFLNTGGYFDHLINHIYHMVEEGFVNRAYLDMVIIESDPERMISRILEYVPKEVDKAKIALGEKD